MMTNYFAAKTERNHLASALLRVLGGSTLFSPQGRRRLAGILGMIVVGFILIARAWTATPAQTTNTTRTIPPPADVAVPPADSEKTASGVASRILKTGSGAVHPVDNDCVRVSYQGWRRDGVLIASSGPPGDSSIQCLRKAMPGIVEALKLMVAGEKRRVWIPGQLTFRPSEPGETAPNVDVTFDVEIIELVQAPATPADLKEPPRTALRMKSGIVVQQLKKGSGTRRPSADSKVTLHFSGWTVDGVLFESTVMAGHPAVFTVGDTLAGWREALLQMVVGDKLRLWIPASLAYGDKPPGHDAPAGNLVYDIELLAVN